MIKGNTSGFLPTGASLSISKWRLREIGVCTTTSAFRVSYSATSGAVPEAVFPYHFNERSQHGILHSLLARTRITVNDVNRIVRLASVTPSSKKEKGFKLYVSSYIDNFEGTYSQANFS